MTSNTFQRVDTLTLQQGDDPISSVIDKNNNIMYIGSGSYPARITKISLNPLRRINSIDLNPGEDYVWTMVIDTINNYLYCATYNSPSKIIKINLNTFTRVADLTTSLNNITTGIIDEITSFAYFADIDTGTIIQIDLISFTETINKLQTSASQGIWSSGIDNLGNGYFGSAVPGSLNSVSDIVKVNLNINILTEETNLILPSGEYAPSQIYIDNTTRIGYFVTYAEFPNMNKVIRINTSDLIKDVSIDGVVGGSYGGVIDKNNQMLYLGGDGDLNSNVPGSIIKIDLATFQKVDIINLNSDEIYPDTAVIDNNGNIYFGIYPSIGYDPKIIKIGTSSITSNPECVNCDLTKNYCISGNCIPKDYVLYGGAGFIALLLLTR